MILFALILAHVLLFLLVAPVPIRVLLLHLRLMHPLERKPGWRSSYYLTNMCFLWLQVLLLAILSIGLNWSPRTLGLQLPTNEYLAGLILALFLLFVLGSIILLRVMLRDPRARSFVHSSFAFFPHTGRERLLFLFWALSAGFGEELLYRGFLPLYLARIFPHVPFLWAMVVAALLFGIVHMSRGLISMIGNGLMGLFFGFCYVSTGSILLPMLLHMLFDMRLLLIDYVKSSDQPEQSVQGTPLPD